MWCDWQHPAGWTYQKKFNPRNWRKFDGIKPTARPTIPTLPAKEETYSCERTIFSHVVFFFVHRVWEWTQWGWTNTNAGATGTSCKSRQGTPQKNSMGGKSVWSPRIGVSMRWHCREKPSKISFASVLGPVLLKQRYFLILNVLLSRVLSSNSCADFAVYLFGIAPHWKHTRTTPTWRS